MKNLILLLFIVAMSLLSQKQQKQRKQQQKAARPQNVPTNALPQRPQKPAVKPAEPEAIAYGDSDYMHPATPAKGEEMQHADPTTENSPNQPEFDVRQAVIYSEILRPKFDNDEVC